MRKGVSVLSRPYMLQYWPSRQDVPTGRDSMKVVEVTNYFLIGPEICSIGRNLL